MLFGDANCLLRRHEPSGPHSQVIRAIVARSLVREPEKRGHHPRSALIGDCAFPDAMHRSAQRHGTARVFDRLIAYIASAIVRLPHLGASARKWGSGFTGMPKLKCKRICGTSASEPVVPRGIGVDASFSHACTELTFRSTGQAGTV